MEDEKTRVPASSRPKLSREQADRLAEEIMAGERFARSGSLLQTLVNASYQAFDLEIVEQPSHTSSSGTTVVRRQLRVRP